MTENRQELFKPFFDRLEELLASRDFIIAAIDGRCASGKTTLAGIIKEKYDCNVLHMDHFFLRPEQRTKERLSEPGGNIDYERFKEQALDKLLGKGPFSYQPYDCSTGKMGGEIFFEPKKLNIIEGVYSLHPFFGDVFDIKVFLKISPEEQSRRILERNGMEMREKFMNVWIPLENEYFKAFNIEEKCKFSFNTD